MIICNFAANLIFSKRKIPINLRGRTTRPKKEQSFPRKSFPRSSCSYQQISDCVCSHHSLLLTLFVFCTSKSSEQTNFFPKKKLHNGTLLAPPDVISQTVEFLSLCGKASLLRSFSVSTWKGNFSRFFVACFPRKMLSSKINLNGDHASLICHTFIVFFSQVTRIHKRYSASQLFFPFFTTKYILRVPRKQNLRLKGFTTTHTHKTYPEWSKKWQNAFTYEP